MARVLLFPNKGFTAKGLPAYNKGSAGTTHPNFPQPAGEASAGSQSQTVMHNWRRETQPPNPEKSRTRRGFV